MFTPTLRLLSISLLATVGLAANDTSSYDLESRDDNNPFYHCGCIPVDQSSYQAAAQNLLGQLGDGKRITQNYFSIVNNVVVYVCTGGETDRTLDSVNAYHFLGDIFSRCGAYKAGSQNLANANAGLGQTNIGFMNVPADGDFCKHSLDSQTSHC